MAFDQEAISVDVAHRLRQLREGQRNVDARPCQTQRTVGERSQHD